MASSEKSAKGKVTGSAGRFGCRYGRFVRKRVAEMEKISRADHRCPKCDTHVGAAQRYRYLGMPEVRVQVCRRRIPARDPGPRVALRAIDRTSAVEENTR